MRRRNYDQLHQIMVLEEREWHVLQITILDPPQALEKGSLATQDFCSGPALPPRPQCL